MSYPSSSKWVAKEWRNVCGVAGFDSPALRTAVSRPSVKPIRADDVFAALRLPDVCSGSLREIPTANPTLCRHWGICAPGHLAERLGPSRVRDRAGVAP